MFLRDGQSSELIPPEEKMQSSRIILHEETWQAALMLPAAEQICCVLIFWEKNAVFIALAGDKRQSCFTLNKLLHHVWDCGTVCLRVCVCPV